MNQQQNPQNPSHNDGIIELGVTEMESLGQHLKAICSITARRIWKHAYFNTLIHLAMIGAFLSLSVFFHGQLYAFGVGVINGSDSHLMRAAVIVIPYLLGPLTLFLAYLFYRFEKAHRKIWGVEFNSKHLGWNALPVTLTILALFPHYTNTWVQVRETSETTSLVREAATLIDGIQHASAQEPVILPEPQKEVVHVVDERSEKTAAWRRNTNSTVRTFRLRSDFARVLRYDQLIQEAVAKYPNVPLNVERGLIAKESEGFPGVCSDAKACGLTQEIIGNTLGPNAYPDCRGINRKDPRQSIFCGVNHLSVLIDQFNGDVGWALAYYNASIRSNEAAMAIIKKIRAEEGGVWSALPHLLSETRDYIPTVLAYADAFAAWEKQEATRLTDIRLHHIPTYVELYGDGRGREQSVPEAAPQPFQRPTFEQVKNDVGSGIAQAGKVLPATLASIQPSSPPAPLVVAQNAAQQQPKQEAAVTRTAAETKPDLHTYTTHGESAGRVALRYRITVKDLRLLNPASVITTHNKLNCWPEDDTIYDVCTLVVPQLLRTARS